jgi:hypothetical protein
VKINPGSFWRVLIRFFNPDFNGYILVLFSTFECVLALIVLKKFRARFFQTVIQVFGRRQFLEKVYYSIQLVILIVARKDGQSQVEFSAQAPQRPKVDLGVVPVDAINNLLKAVLLEPGRNDFECRAIGFGSGSKQSRNR